VKNWVKLATGFGFALAGILIASVFIIRNQQTEELNWTRLSQAEGLISQKQFDPAHQIIEDILKSNSDATLNLMTIYQKGILALEEKKFDDAVQAFSDVMSRAGKNPIRALALINKGFAFEQKQDFASAAKSYQEFMDQYSEHFLAARTQLYLGRALLLSGDKEGAKKALGQLIDLYPTSQWAENARKILEKI
jgi:TolA-binding protein